MNKRRTRNDLSNINNGSIIFKILLVSQLLHLLVSFLGHLFGTESMFCYFTLSLSLSWSLCLSVSLSYLVCMFTCVHSHVCIHMCVYVCKHTHGCIHGNTNLSLLLWNHEVGDLVSVIILYHTDCTHPTHILHLSDSLKQGFLLKPRGY